MNCRQARRRLRSGTDLAAEEHVAACGVCFDVLERGDVLLRLLRQARPEAIAPPPGLVAGSISRWQRRRRLPWAVAAAVLVAATIPSAALIWFAITAYSEPLVLVQLTLAGLLKPVLDLAALLDEARSRLLDNPEWLSVLVVLGGAAGAAFAAVYRELGSQPQGAAA